MVVGRVFGPYGLERRIVRLEVVDRIADSLVEPDTLRRMAAVVFANPLDAKLHAVAATVLPPPIEDVEAARARARPRETHERRPA